MISENHGPASHISEKWPLEPVYWTSPVTKNGRLVGSSTRVRVMEIYGNRNLVISRTNDNEYLSGNYSQPESLTSPQRSKDMSSSRDSPCSQLSEYSTPSSYGSPSHSPKMSRATSGSGSTSWNSPSKSSNRSTAGGPQRRRGPGFILRPKSKTVAVGERLCLKCSLLGHPKPTVTWEKDGELVDEDITNGHIRTCIDGNDYQLVVEVAGPDDAGKYAVTARNSLGKQTAAVDVIVTGTEKNINSFQTRKTDVYSPNGGIRKHHDPNPQYSNTNGKNASVKSTRTSSRYSRSNKDETSTEDDRYSHRGRLTKQRARSDSIAPTFVQRLSSTQVLEGEELLLQCEVSGDPDPTMEWRRNGVPVGVDEDEVFTSFREGMARLRLRDVQPQHAGEYVCVAKNEGGAVQCSSRVTVKARRVEIPPQFTKSPSDIRLNDGETLTIEAEVDGTPTPEIVWSLDGEELSGVETSYRGKVARLVIHNVTSSNNGQYVCSALNYRGEDSVACRVRVRRKRLEIPPEFIKHLADVNTDENNDVRLRCVVTGYPDPAVQWMYNEEVITSDDGVHITYVDGVACLIVEQATQEDSGCYTCVAENSAGRVLSRCKVIVQGPVEPIVTRNPTAPEFLSQFDEYIRVQEGDSLTLSCGVSGYPQPDVTWTINDRKIENGKAEYEDGKAQLEISPIISNHGGHVKCQLTNPVGTASYQARIYVRTKRVAPTFEELLPQTVNITEGEEAYFQCKVAGHPQPRVAWTRDGRTLSVLSADTSYENGVASVRIRKAGPRDSGLYVCVARNLSGEAESSCKVLFLGKDEPVAAPKDKPPQFTLPLADVVVEEGADIKFKCHVAGNPRPKLTWNVDGEELSAEDGDARFDGEEATLLLADAAVEDSGKYQCVAVNRAGRVTSSCHVTVTAPKPSKPAPRPQVEPSFLIPLEDKTVIEGKDLLLKAKVTGNPRPQVTWLLDGDEVEDAEVKYSDDGSTEFLLKEVLLEDGGVYSCIAKNPLEQVSSSCRVNIKSIPQVPMKTFSPTKTEAPSKKMTDDNAASSAVDEPPKFISSLSDVTVQDGVTGFALSCKVSGNPTARWFHEGEEISSVDGFELVSVGDVRKLVFAEVFPDDSGEYACVISNKLGEAKSVCKVTVEEIEGEPPVFLQKPKPLTVKIGGVATFSCRVDGDPQPTVQWTSANQVVEGSDRIRLTPADPSNNHTYTLEISPVTAHDAGKYSVCCRNLIGDATCTISLIVDDVKKQEVKTDFRGVLKKSPSVKSPTAKTSAEENPNFRSVLRKASNDKDNDRRTSESSEQRSIDYKQVLSTNVKTKALTEEERKAQRAEQKDFRDKLVRRIDTKVISQDALRTKTSDQVDFREEVLKTKVRTKTMSQDDYKTMHGEQKDFRSETIKSRVVTKAYREENIKAKKAEQVDFRNVLSPTKRDGEMKVEEQGVAIADIPRAKWKKEVDHTIVSSRRARHRNAAAPAERKTQTEDPVFREPDFIRTLSDLIVQDGTPFELVCSVTGDPRPTVTWFFKKEKLEADEDITISHKGDECLLSISESFLEDQGPYTCEAVNEHGRATSSCYVTVLENDQ